MKREALNHTKMRRLSRALGIPIWGARGICESLWHLAEREAPQGDLGKLSDDDIAIGIDWEAPSDTLIAALKQAELLDESVEHRYIVHDWSQHANDSVHAKLARAGMLFADGKPPNLSRLPTKERPAIEKRIASACRALAKRKKKTVERLPYPTVPNLTPPDLTLPPPANGEEKKAALELLRCPRCQAPDTLMRERATGNRPDPGWWCVPKRGGCNTNFHLGDQRIVSALSPNVQRSVEAELRERLGPAPDPVQAAAEELDARLTREFYAERGSPQALARECAEWVTANAAAFTDREGVDQWLVRVGAPHHVRIEVLRRALPLIEEAHARRTTDGGPAVPAQAERADSEVPRAAREAPGVAAGRDGGSGDAGRTEALQGRGGSR
jgi:hypothetical protein